MKLDQHGRRRLAFRADRDMAVTKRKSWERSGSAFDRYDVEIISA